MSKKKVNKTNLTKGAPLEVEDLNLSQIGLYSDEQKVQLIKEGVPENDFFDAVEAIGKFGAGFWARKSDEGVKRHTFSDRDIKFNKKE